MVQGLRWHRKTPCKVLWEQPVLCVEHRMGGFRVEAWGICRSVSGELAEEAGKGSTDRSGPRTVGKGTVVLHARIFSLTKCRWTWLSLRLHCRPGLVEEAQKDSETAPS